jgi:hypothetical protein
MGRGQKTYLLGSLVKLAGAGPGLRLAQPGSPTDRFSVLFPLFYLMMKAESIFRNVVILLSYNLNDGQRPKEQFYT